MTSGELSFDFPPSLRVTWTFPDIFLLATKSGYSLRSPEFAFADGRYCLRLFTMGELNDYIEIDLLNLTDGHPGRAALHDVQWEWEAEEIFVGRCLVDGKLLFFIGDALVPRDETVVYVPGGTSTVLCSVRLRTPSGPGSPESGGAQTGVIPRYTMCGELSFVSHRFLHVTWRIPGFLQFLSEYHTLESPEFRFSDCRYCLRLLPPEDSDYVEIHLVNLSDRDTKKYASCEVGLKSTTGEESGAYYYDTPSTREFYFSLNELDNKKSECFPDGHLTVFCCMGSREPSSEGCPKSGGAETPDSNVAVPQAAACRKSVGVQTSNEEEYQEGLPETKNSVSRAIQTEIPERVSSCAIQTEVPDNVCCAIQTEVPDSVPCAIRTEIPERVSCATQTEVPYSLTNQIYFRYENGSSLDTKGVSKCDYRYFLQAA